MSKTVSIFLLLCFCTNIHWCCCDSDSFDDLLDDLFIERNYDEAPVKPVVTAASTTSANAIGLCPARSHCAQHYHRFHVKCYSKQCGDCLPGYAVASPSHSMICLKIQAAASRKKTMKREISETSPQNDPDVDGLSEAMKQRDYPVSDSVDVPAYDWGKNKSSDPLQIENSKRTNFLVLALIVLLAVFIFLLVVVFLVLCWCGYCASESPKKSTPSMGDSSMDRKLAQSAQVYHFQHEKQRIIAEEQENAKHQKSAFSLQGSDDEDDAGHNVVLEFAGPAAGDQKEVRNPLFRPASSSRSSSSSSNSHFGKGTSRPNQYP